MLQDIDRRNAAGHTATDPHPPPRNVSTRRPRRGLPRIFVIAGVGVAVVAAIGAVAVAVWRDGQVKPMPMAAPVASPIAPAVPVAPPATMTATATSALQGPPAAEPVAAAPPPVEIQPAADPTAIRGAFQPSRDTLKLSMELSALVAEMPAAGVSTRRPITAPVAMPPPLPGTTTITNLPVRQVAAEETIAAARTMWHDGAHAAALATLRESLAAAETTRNPRAIVLLGRELARLEIADNRPQQALDLLKRLEPGITHDADAWALRGNAEQRLALHADAVESYLAALRIRPTEGKWMLGAAISLAVSGKLAEAQVWVDRAKERDALTPTISAYLQQLGLNVRR